VKFTHGAHCDSDKFWITNVKCTGEEDKLSECSKALTLDD